MIDIGSHLKSDEVIEFLENHDLSVEYHFDRLHEGESDSYTVESEDPPIALRFDADQRCATIWVREPAVVLAQALVSFPDLRSPSAIEAYARDHALPLRRGPSWLRCDGAGRSIHYEFEGPQLRMVTIMSLPPLAP